MNPENAATRLTTPLIKSQSEDEIAAFAPKRLRSRSVRPNAKFALTKQPKDPIEYLKKGVRLLKKAKRRLLKNQAFLLDQAIALVQHAQAHTQPEPPMADLTTSIIASITASVTEAVIALMNASLNERLSRIENTLASGSFIGSQASSFGSVNIGRTKNSANTYAEAASRNSNISSIPLESSNPTNGFRTMPLTHNQPKRNFTDQRVILIGSSNSDWQKDVKATRDKLNEALKLRLNTQQLIIASITKTAYSQNIVLVATQHYSAQDLMSNSDLIQSVFAFERMQKDV